MRQMSVDDIFSSSNFRQLTVPMILRRRYKILRRINARHDKEPIMTTNDFLVHCLPNFQIDSIVFSMRRSSIPKIPLVRIKMTQVIGSLDTETRWIENLKFSFCRVSVVRVTVGIDLMKQFPNCDDKNLRFLVRLEESANKRNEGLFWVFFRIFPCLYGWCDADPRSCQKMM